MRDYIEIGPSPASEDCVQLGSENYHILAREECQRFIEFIRKHKGNEPNGARLFIKSNPHDFGTYLEVACYFDDKLPESEEYAFACESDLPGTWDAEVRHGH